jgi:hypothetical protein
MLHRAVAWITEQVCVCVRERERERALVSRNSGGVEEGIKVDSFIF